VTGTAAAPGVSAAAFVVVASPQRIALAAAAERTGLPSLDGSASLMAGPYLAAAFGAVTVFWAIWAGASARRWQASSRRHDPGAAADVVEDDPFSSWDALSRGEDPT
jgi:hypothetical protein